MSATLQDIFAFEGAIEAAVSTMLSNAGVTEILTRGEYAAAKDTHVEVRLDPGEADIASLDVAGAGMEYISRAGTLEISVATDRRMEVTNTSSRLIQDAIVANCRVAMLRQNAAALNALLPNHVVTDMRDLGVERSLSEGVGRNNVNVDVTLLRYAIIFEFKPSSWPTSG